jgi:hypothetical protein
LERNELRSILRAEGINPGTYSLDGGHPSEQYVLAISPGGWAVYYSERGNEPGRREFDTEDEACRYLLETLRADPTTHFQLVIGPLPAHEADAAFDQWLRDTGVSALASEDVKIDSSVLSQGKVRRYWVRGTKLPTSD